MNNDDGDLENDAIMPNTNRKAEGRRPRVFTEQERMQKLLISKWNMKVLAMTMTMTPELLISKKNILFCIFSSLNLVIFQVKRRKKLFPGKTGNESESSDDDVFYR